MKIAVMGTGGVGGYFGGHLAAAGVDVSFIARGAHLSAIRERGLRIEVRGGDIHVRPLRATYEPAEVDLVDVVLFCVKLYDTEEAGARLAPLMGPESSVISLQNGGRRP